MTRRLHPADLPYGVWSTLNGREILFNRKYVPLWQRMGGETPRRADPTEWVAFAQQEWFYDDKTADKRGAARKVLCAWGLA